MKRILAHSKSDAQKRRDEFEEHYKTYSGHGYDLDKIKKTVNKELDSKFLRYYHGESAKFSNEPNPIVSFCDGRMQFTEQGLYGSLLQCFVARGDQLLDAHALASILSHERHHEA